MTTLALVTGGNRGLGFATSRALADHGAHVIIGARRDDAGRPRNCGRRDCRPSTSSSTPSATEVVDAGLFRRAVAW